VSKLLKVLLGCFAALVVVIGAGVAFIVLRDSAEEEASLEAITAGTSLPDQVARTSADGTWTVEQGDQVWVGYRVHEILRGLDKEVTGRTGDVTGSMTIDGSTITEAELTADLTGLTSDDPIRDNAIRTRGLESATYPETTFRLTEPITLDAPPAMGQPVTATATGDLTVRDQTRSIDIPLTAQWDGDQIAVATVGQGVRLEFADFGFGAIEVPIARTDDFGFLEVQLRFVPA
jgi:polyisoprenoid-binding protein YceI